MQVFFIRHGQTNGNLAKRHQHPNTPLNDEGVEQVRRIATQLRAKDITYIISSRQKRALHTAEIIGKALEIVPETDELFEEMYRPAYLIGERRTGWFTWRYMLLWYLGFQPASMHDGETYENFRQRLRAGRSYLESLPADTSVVVVSHAAYISFFLAYLNRDTKLGFFRTAWLFFSMIRLQNTAISHLSYDGTHWHRHHFF